MMSAVVGPHRVFCGSFPQRVDRELVVERERESSSFARRITPPSDRRTR